MGGIIRAKKSTFGKEDKTQEREIRTNAQLWRFRVCQGWLLQNTSQKVTGSITIKSLIPVASWEVCWHTANPYFWVFTFLDRLESPSNSELPIPLSARQWPFAMWSESDTHRPVFFPKFLVFTSRVCWSCRTGSKKYFSVWRFLPAQILSDEPATAKF